MTIDQHICDPDSHEYIPMTQCRFCGMQKPWEPSSLQPGTTEPHRGEDGSQAPAGAKSGALASPLPEAAEEQVGDPPASQKPGASPAS